MFESQPYRGYIIERRGEYTRSVLELLKFGHLFIVVIKGGLHIAVKQDFDRGQEKGLGFFVTYIFQFRSYLRHTSIIYQLGEC